MKDKKKSKKSTTKKQGSVYPFRPSKSEVEACFALARFWDRHPEFI